MKHRKSVIHLSLVLAALSTGACRMTEIDPTLQGTTYGDVKVHGISTSSLARYEKHNGHMDVAFVDVHREAGSDTIAKLAGAGADIAFGVAAIRQSTAALREADASQRIAEKGLTVHGMGFNVNNSNSNSNRAVSSSSSSAASSSSSSARATARNRNTNQNVNQNQNINVPIAVGSF